MLLADEHLDLLGESQKATVEVVGDPLPAANGDAVRGLGGVVALMPAQQHDLGAVILAAHQPRLVLLAECSPEVAVPVWPALGLEAPATVGMALETRQGALPVMPGAVFQSVRVARAGGDLRADTEVTGGGLLPAARGQLVDVLAQLLRRHARAGVGHRQLAHSSSRSFESQPVHVPNDSAAGDRVLGVDRVKPVDGQLAQALKVRALGAEALEQEGRVGDRQLVPAVDRRRGVVGLVGSLRKLAGHLVW